MITEQVFISDFFGKGLAGVGIKLIEGLVYKYTAGMENAES